MASLRHRTLALGMVLSLASGTIAAPVEAGESPQGQLGRLRSADADLEGHLDDLDVWLTEGQDRLQALDGQIEAAEQAVEAAEAEVARAEILVARQQRNVERRAVAAYVRPVGMADVALSGDANLSAEQNALVSQVVAYDQELLGAKERAEARLESDRRAVEGTRNDLADTRDEVTDLLDGIEERRVEAEEARRALDARISQVQAEVDAMAPSGGALADLINNLSDGSGEGAGTLIIPVPGTLTSRFGQRWGRLHAGIDIAASTGTPIRAAADGRTIYSAFMSGYGNVVVVDHGGGLSTLYAHQSRRRTLVGDRLQQGDVLGEVGSTGNSTGAHLHFEVRERGTPVDPIPYLAR